MNCPKVYEPNPNDYIAVDKEAVVLNYEEVKKQIGYPEIAKEINLEGKVVIRILVDEKGKYVKSIVLKDPHPILTKKRNQMR